MNRILFYALLAIVALTMGSCRRAAEKARQNIRVEAVENFTQHGLAGADLTLRVMNNTGYRLALEHAELDLYYGESRVGSISLREGVEVPKRTTGSVTMRWALTIDDPLALYVLSKKLKEGDLSQLRVSYRIDAKGGPKRINISREMATLPEFLNTFGLSMDNVTNYLRK